MGVTAHKQNIYYFSGKCIGKKYGSGASVERLDEMARKPSCR